MLKPMPTNDVGARATYEFHISRVARDRYQFDDTLFSTAW